MSKPKSFQKKISVDVTSQLIAQNADQLPEMLRFIEGIRKEFLETQAEEGVVTAVLCAHKTIDTAQAEAFARNPEVISCHGCTAAYCCHQSVEVCESEAIVIAQYCKENNIPISRKHLQHQLSYSRDQVAAASCSACVFLKDRKCSIYPVRPATCRTYHSINPIELCDTKKHKGVKVWSCSNTAAELIKAVIFEEGGKSDRMPRLLLKYSR